MDSIVQGHVKDQPTASYCRRSVCSENFNVVNIYGHGGFLRAPSSLSLSHLPAIPFFKQQRINQQPPLLPLPIYSTHQSPSPRSQHSCPPTTRRTRNRDQSLTPKKPKSAKRRQGSKASTDSVSDSFSDTPNEKIRPEPKDLPTNVSIVSSSLTTTPEIGWKGFDAAAVEISGSVFTLSPPPSSLPLPRFSVRPEPKIDAGATNDLRRMLRLL